jgi:hypothetical protein
LTCLFLFTLATLSGAYRSGRNSGSLILPLAIFLIVNNMTYITFGGPFVASWVIIMAIACAYRAVDLRQPRAETEALEAEPHPRPLEPLLQPALPNFNHSHLRG